MRYKNLIDMHTHTDNSPDGNHSVTFICESAEHNGLRGIALTDHCECNEYEEHKYKISIRNAFFDAVKAQSIFSGRLIVMSGVEMGQPLQNPEAAKEVLGQYAFDYVMISLHAMKGFKDFYYLNYDEYDPYEILSQYFDELYEMAAHCDYDALAHLDYPLRYMNGEHRMGVTLERFQDKIDKILKIVIARDKAIEINTSGFRHPFGCTMPGKDILKRYHDFGGVYLTIGSDAHTGADVGEGLSKGTQLVYQIGFRHTALYKKRVPILIPIE